MLRSIHIASRHRIVVNVIHLLSHDRLALDKLRMITFFPNLIGASGLVGTLEKSQQFQHAPGVGFFQVADKTPCRPRLETLHGGRESWRGGDEMQVVFHDDITEQREVSLLLQEAPGFEQDLHGFGTGEERQPVVDGGCHEVGVRYFQDTVATSRHVDNPGF